MEICQPIKRLEVEEEEQEEEEEEKKKKIVEITSTGLYLNLTNTVVDKTCVRTGTLTCSPYCLDLIHCLKTFCPFIVTHTSNAKTGIQ